MKKKSMLLILFYLFIISCNSDSDNDGDNTNSSSGNLIRVERTFNNTGNTATYNYEDNGEKVIDYYYNTTILKNKFEYNGNNQMTKATIYSEDGTVNKEYTFSYDGSGNMISVHDYDSSPFYNYEPQNQDRTITWTGNTMSIPLLVDTDSNNYDNYEFTFNSNDLLTEYKVTKWNGTIKLLANFEYDSNTNPTKMFGYYMIGGVQVDFVNDNTFDDKENPFYKHYNKYYLTNLIFLGGRIDGGLYISNLLNIFHHFGKNNSLSVLSNGLNSYDFSYQYNGDFPIESQLIVNGSVLTTTEFIYE